MTIRTFRCTVWLPATIMIALAIWLPTCRAQDTANTPPTSQASPNTNPTTNPSWLSVSEPRFLHVLLKLRDDTIENDRRVVEALRELRWFTHIILVTPSWQEKPNATTHPFVVQALAICKEKNIPVVWGRWLWVAWQPGHHDRAPTTGAEYDTTHYAQAISVLKREAKAIGAVATFLDCEPYGKCPQMISLKRKKLSDDDRRKMLQAMKSAVTISGRVDMVYPTSSSDSPWHFAWPMAELGVLRCDAKTYYARSPYYKLPRILPPPGFTQRVDLWGSAVGLGRPQDIYNGNKTLTSSEVVALDLTKIRKRFPHCLGYWVWVSHDILPEVIRSWPK